MRSRLEDYNYYNDPRVQAGMFSHRWKTIDEESGFVTVAFDECWAMDSIYELEIDRLISSWVEEGREITEAYRSLECESSKQHSNLDNLRENLIQIYEYFWKVPEREREELDQLRKLLNKANQDKNQEYFKLFEIASSQLSARDVAKRLGFHSPTQNRDPSSRWWDAPNKFDFMCNDEDEDAVPQSNPFCLRVPVRFEVCSMCEGHGKVVNPSIDCCGLTRDDFDDDPDFAEDYLSGVYDIVCPACNGKRVEAVPQFPEWLENLLEKDEEAQWDGIREQCSELARGA